MDERVVPFGSLSGLDADELIPLDKALDCSDVVVWDGTLRGRNGYRNALPASVGGAGAVQGLWRYRPGVLSASPAAKTVAARGGKVYGAADPSTEILSDGASLEATDQAGGTITPFGGAANVSAAQLGKYLYMASDETGITWRRMRSDYKLESLVALDKGAKPAGATTGPAKTLFNSLAAPTLSGGVASAALFTDWVQFTGMVQGSTVEYTLPGGANWASYNWLQLFITPPTQSNGAGHIKVSVAVAAGSYFDVSEMYDTPGDGSPDVIWVDLRSLDAATRLAPGKIKFTLISGGGQFAVHAYMPIPNSPGSGPQQYYTTFYNSVTLQESLLTDPVIVQINSDGLVIPTYHAVYAQYASFNDGNAAADSKPESIPFARNFNAGATIPYPSTGDYSGLITISGAIPGTVSAGPLADTVRLWRLTSTGIRLVKTAPIINGQATYSITDDTGQATLSHQLYIPGGTPPPCSAMAARGGRIVCAGDPANPNRVNISSYVPFGATTDPFPQFPASPQTSSDGWSFDVGPSPAEQILYMVDGDALYLLSNEAAYSIYDLSAPIGGAIPPLFRIVGKGIIGRRAATWAEQSLYWCSHDGIYSAYNRVDFQEFSQDIRRLYLTWFLPDNTVVMGYQDRKLYAVRGTKMLCYDFVKKMWSRHNLTHSMSHAAQWRDPSGTLQRLWFLESTGKLMRWQPGVSFTDAGRAASDDGSAIPAWTYGTGFAVTPAKMRTKFVYLDSGGATVTVYKDIGGAGRAKTFASGEHELAFAPDIVGYKLRLVVTAANAVQVKRLMWERLATTGKGG